MANTTPQHTTKPRTGHAFKGLQDWIEVFTAGTHVDSKGREATFTAEDLDQLAANVAGAGVPAVIGHPKEDAPAYAWAPPGQVKREGDALLVKFADINPAFEAGVDGGAYRERSVSVYKDAKRGWVLQHVGWLGAMAPAIAGLAPLAYSAALPADAAEAEVHEFASMDAAMSTGWALQDMAQLLRGLRDWLIGKEGLDIANQVLPDWTLNSVADAARRIHSEAQEAQGNGPGNAFARTTPTAGDPPMTTITEADVQRARDEAAVAATAATSAQFAAQGQALDALRLERQTERIGTQIHGWKAAGLVLPAEEHGLAEFMVALEGGQAAEFQFSAADKSSAKKTPQQWFAEFVAGRKAMVKLAANGGGQLADPNGAPTVNVSDYRALAKAATEFQAKEALAGRAVSTESAVAHVVQQNTVA